MLKSSWFAAYLRTFCAAFLLSFSLLSCQSTTQPIVKVTVSGIDDTSKTVRVDTKLDGKRPKTPVGLFDRELASFELHLDVDVTGSLEILVYVQGSDGCDNKSGSATVTIAGNTTYETTVTLAKTEGCFIQIRKSGEGGGQVSLSDGTIWQFERPTPAQEQCPVAASPTETMQIQLPYETKVNVYPSVSTDVGRGSFVAAIRGCALDATAECQVEVASGTTTIDIVFSPIEVCSGSGFCWDHPRPQGQTIYRVVGGKMGLWAAGESALLFRSIDLFTVPRTPAVPRNLRGLAVINDDAIVAVGDKGAILRRDETEWKCTATESVTSATDLQDVWGSSKNDIWTVGTKGSIYHFTGSGWQPVSVAGLSAIDLHSISGSSAKNIYAVGDMGTVLHYDGTSWKTVAFPTTDSLRGVWVNEKGDAWVAGEKGTVATIVDSLVMVKTTPTTKTLRGIYGVDETNIWAVGDSGTILHFDGSTWVYQYSATTQDLLSVWAMSSFSAWAVGTAGTVLYYNGSAWIPQNTGVTTNSLNGVTAPINSQSSDSEIIAVGDQGTALRYSGTDWTPEGALHQATTRSLRATAASSNSDYWVVGDAGTVLHWDQRVVATHASGTTADLFAVWVNTPTDVIAVGSGGVLTRYDGTKWTVTTLAAAGGRALRAIWGTSATNLWFAGDGGALLRWNGTTATVVPGTGSTNLRALWGSGATDIWAVGDAGSVYHYDGTAWTQNTQVTSVFDSKLLPNLLGVRGASAKEVYIVGDGGITLVYGGTAWARKDSGVVRDLRAIWINNRRDVVFVGQAATVIRKRPLR